MKPEDQKRMDNAVAQAKKERKFGSFWVCHNDEVWGHALDCRLAAFLKGGEQ